MKREPRTLLGICALFSFVIAVAIGALLSGCAPLGLGAPVGRAIPLAVKEGGELGTCASSGYEVDVPPHATVATVASVCVRPYVASSATDASSGDASSSPPSSIPPPTLSIQRPSFPTAPSAVVRRTAADEVVSGLESEARDG